MKTKTIIIMALLISTILISGCTHNNTIIEDEEVSKKCINICEEANMTYNNEDTLISNLRGQKLIRCACDTKWM